MLGSVIQLVSSTGSVTSQYAYDPYGNRTVVSGSTNSDIGYAGYFYLVPSGLNFTMYRAYDPAHARWLNRDTAGEAGGINLYAYVEESPTSFVDPLGLWSISGGAYMLPWGAGTEFTIGKYDGRFFVTGRIGIGMGIGYSFNPDGKPPGPDVSNSCKGGIILSATAKGGLRSGPVDLEGELGLAKNYTLDDWSVIHEFINEYQFPWEGVEFLASAGTQLTLYQGKH